MTQRLGRLYISLSIVGGKRDLAASIRFASTTAGLSKRERVKVNGMKINGIDAIYYYAHDFGRAQAFYSAMIGAQPSIAIPDSYCEWSLPNGEAFGLIKGAEFRPGNGVLFNVDDVKASVAELRASGVVFNDDGEIEETPVCYMAFGNDSEGNSFILHQRK